MKITTDMIGSETASVRQARLKSVYDWYKGDGAYVAAGNLGVVRTAFNEYLASDIANLESFASWLLKFNLLNSPDTLIRTQLFGSGAKGVWFDPNDLPTLTQDSAGTVPVTAAGQAVGTMIDKSDKESAVAGVRPNLLLFPNDFNNAVWTKQAGVTTTGGQLAPDGSSTAQRVDFGVADRALSQDLVVPAGNYTTVLTIKGVAGETIRIKPGMNPESVRTLTGDWQTIVVGAKGVISSFGLNTYGGVTARTIYVWSPKFESGLYATQAVAAKRPIYGVIPKSGRRNLLSNSNNFAASPWFRSRLIPTPGSAVGPDGAMSMSFVAETAENGEHLLNHPFNYVAGQPYTISAYCRASTRSVVSLVLPSAAFGSNYLGVYNAATGESIIRAGATGGMIHLGGGLYRVWLSAVATITVAEAAQVRVQSEYIDSLAGYVGDGVSGLHVSDMQLDVGSVPSSRQRVVSNYDITESGVQSLPYLASDLIDDELPAAVPSLGSNATVWFAVDGASTILTGQTVAAGTIATLRGARTYAMGAIDRPLTAGETAALTTYLGKARGAL